MRWTRTWFARCLLSPWCVTASPFRKPLTVHLVHVAEIHGAVQSRIDRSN